MKYCVYNHNIIDRGILSHYRQFRETRDGDQLPMFPNNRAIIEIDLTDRYKVRTAIGEVLFIGTGFDEAIRRIHYAQPDAEIEVIANGRRLTLEELEFLNDEST
ncbi:hypothetical protein A3Q35_01180 [Aeribacillus pallidus]|uniref:hypothetical protein n=1 Tax=Aeribacillus pallidus TaxID=33936 RepID=UPI0007B4EAFE|nr:hypothetical protein [Aeribacillus pallidus]KZM55194.1 hypothetical protein A3Q35_01180 [Aeribacillus pallidus]